MNTMLHQRYPAVKPVEQNKPRNPDSDNLTLLLQGWGAGDQSALNRLIDITYQQLAVYSRRLMRNEQSYHTLQTEALLHEAYFRLRELQTMEWRDRAHFFSVWSGIMRRVLIDHARKNHAEKRGGQEKPVLLDEAHYMAPDAQKFSEIYQAIDRLKSTDETKALIVELRYFVGLSIEEISVVLEISPATVKRKWSVAKAVLFSELKDALC